MKQNLIFAVILASGILMGCSKSAPGSSDAKPVAEKPEKSIPKCNDSRTTDLVIENFKKPMGSFSAKAAYTNDMMETGGIPYEQQAFKRIEKKGKELEGQLKYEVTAIRTTEINQQTGAYNCAADLVVTDPSGVLSKIYGSNDNGVIKAAIKYGVEVTDNHDQFIVSILEAEGKNTPGQDFVKVLYGPQEK